MIQLTFTKINHVHKNSDSPSRSIDIAPKTNDIPPELDVSVFASMPVYSRSSSVIVRTITTRISTTAVITATTTPAAQYQQTQHKQPQCQQPQYQQPIVIQQPQYQPVQHRRYHISNLSLCSNLNVSRCLHDCHVHSIAHKSCNHYLQGYEHIVTYLTRFVVIIGHVNKLPYVSICLFPNDSIFSVMRYFHCESIALYEF